MVGQVDTVHCAAVSNTVEVRAVVGDATERTATRDFEAFEHVAVQVILVEVVSSASVAPVGGIEVVAVVGHTIVTAFRSCEGHHQIPSSAAALGTAGQSDVVQAHDVLVVAVEVTESDVGLASVGAQVNSVVVPSAKSQAVAVA